jgi:hypothetical protein
VNRYILIRRLRGPAFLLLVGINALLAQSHVLGWSKSWPFYLILGGLLVLAERAALAADGGAVPPPFGGVPYAGAPYAGGPSTGSPAAPPATDSTAIVPSHEYGDDIHGGQS